jgi:hypothetical protein
MHLIGDVQNLERLSHHELIGRQYSIGVKDDIGIGLYDFIGGKLQKLLKKPTTTIQAIRSVVADVVRSAIQYGIFVYMSAPLGLTDGSHSGAGFGQHEYSAHAGTQVAAHTPDCGWQSLVVLVRSGNYDVNGAGSICEPFATSQQRKEQVSPAPSVVPACWLECGQYQLVENGHDISSAGSERSWHGTIPGAGLITVRAGL